MISSTGKELFLNVQIEAIAQPESGWPVAMYCPICKTLTIVNNPWAIKPTDGDFWLMNPVCESVEHTLRLGARGCIYPPDYLINTFSKTKWPVIANNA